MTEDRIITHYPTHIANVWAREIAKNAKWRCTSCLPPYMGKCPTCGGSGFNRAEGGGRQ